MAPGHAAAYFREFFATTDIVAGPEEVIDTEHDKPEEIDYKLTLAEARLARIIQRLQAIKQTVESSVFRSFEQNLMATVEHIEKVAIWDALDKNDFGEIARLIAERKGIVALFQLYDPIEVKINERKAELAMCQRRRDIYVKGIEEPRG
jgi:hypothetical protein